ncbi:MAG: PucR family transcriptional regulator, partial [Actinomycetota bacterium]
MVQRYRDEIVDYSTLDDEILYGDVAVISLDNLRALLSNLQRGDVIRPEELEEFRGGAARRVHQGVPLDSVLHAYRLWGQIVWQTILDAARP